MNNFKLIKIIIIILLIIILFSINLDKGRKEITEKAEAEVLGFYVNWTQDNLSSYHSLMEYFANIDIISPYWYSIDSKGSLLNLYQIQPEKTLSLSRRENIAVIPLFTNKNVNHNILIEEKAREKAIQNIVNTVIDNNYHGAFIDFEYLPGQLNNELSNFVKDLSRRLHNRDKLLHIAVFPKVDFPENLNSVYNYKQLAIYADKITIMTYDKHKKNDAPGPIAPINWVEENIQYALKYIPADKLHLGIATYGYEWTRSGKARGLGANEIIDLARKEGKEVLWDEEFKTPYFQYRDRKNNLNKVWFEDSKSLKYKLELVKEYNLGGISIWKLGYETENFWEVLKLLEGIKREY